MLYSEIMITYVQICSKICPVLVNYISYVIIHSQYIKLFPRNTNLILFGLLSLLLIRRKKKIIATRIVRKNIRISLFNARHVTFLPKDCWWIIQGEKISTATQTSTHFIKLHSSFGPWSVTVLYRFWEVCQNFWQLRRF